LGLPYHSYFGQVQCHGYEVFPYGGRIVADENLELIHHSRLYTFGAPKSIGEGLIPL
jgi:hypothetical protein